VYSQASACGATCGVAGVTIRTATCMAYSGGSTNGVAVANFNAFNGTNTLYAGCGNCVSQTSPCPPVPACVTYGCVYSQASSCLATCGVAGVTIRTATCMSYSGGSNVGVPVTTSNFGNFAGCGNCVSQTSPCPPVPACVSYVCSIGAYSACSVTCGAGVQTRAVQCLAQGGGQTGQAVSLSLCPGGTCQGALTQPCTMCPSNTGFNTGFITPTFIAPQVVNTGGFIWTPVTSPITTPTFTTPTFTTPAVGCNPAIQFCGQRRSGSKTVEAAAAPSTETDSDSTLLPVLAGSAGLIVLMAGLATTWMVADARARKSAKLEASLYVGSDMATQTEH
jgi:hypothetical protein